MHVQKMLLASSIVLDCIIGAKQRVQKTLFDRVAYWLWHYSGRAQGCMNKLYGPC
jgi:hypothetical protein